VVADGTEAETETEVVETETVADERGTDATEKDATDHARLGVEEKHTGITEEEVEGETSAMVEEGNSTLRVVCPSNISAGNVAESCFLLPA
jgi:hypothetical protein